MRLVNDGWAEDPKTGRTQASGLARRALQVAESDPSVLVNAAFVLGHLVDEDIGAMIGPVDRALALNPSFARGWSLSGFLRVFAGQHELAVTHIETSMRLSPRERVGSPLTAVGQAYFFQHRFDEAVAKLSLAIQDNPGHPTPYRALAACYAHMGRKGEASATIARLRAVTTELFPVEMPWRNRDDRDLFMSGLSVAMGEAG